MLLNILQISWVSLISKQSHCPKLNATLVQLAASSDEIPLPNSFGVWMVLLASAKPELLGAPTARRVCAAAAAAPTVCCIIACVSAIVVVKHLQKFHVTLQGIPRCHHKKMQTMMKAASQKITHSKIVNCKPLSRRCPVKVQSNLMLLSHLTKC